MGNVRKGSSNSVGLVTVLTYGMGAGPLAMYVLGVLSPLIVTDLGLGHAQYGVIASIGFSIATIASLTVGPLVDRIPPRVAIYAIALTSSLALLVLSLANSFGVLILAVVFAGICLSLSTPATNRILSSEVTTGRGFVMGIKQSGVQVSQVFASLVFPGLALLIGWRWSATSGILVGCIGAALVWKFVPAAIRDRSGSKLPLGVSKRRLKPVVWLLALYSFTVGVGAQAANVHLPLFAHDGLGMSVALAGVTTAVCGVVGVLSRVFWGRASDSRLSPKLLLACMSVLSVGAGALLVGAAATGTWAMLWFGVSIFGASALASNAVVMMALMNEMDVASLGRATSVAAAGLYLGFATGPFAFGLLVETSGSYVLAWSLVTMMFAASAVISFAWVLLGASRRRGGERGT